MGDEPPAVSDGLARLATASYAVLRSYVDLHLCDALAAEAHALTADPTAHEAGIGRGSDRTLDGALRRARIHWLGEATSADCAFARVADDLRIELNRTLFLGLRTFDAQLALTPKGGFYKRHFDSFHGKENRVVSLVVYLDRNWTADDGGCLRIWPPPCTSNGGEGSPVDVVPTAGTMVLMLSEEVPHEVLISHRARPSIAGWFGRA